MYAMQLSNEKELTFNFMFMAQKNKDKFFFFSFVSYILSAMYMKARNFFQKPSKNLFSCLKNKTLRLKEKARLLLLQLWAVNRFVGKV
jgi:hypothetical protein